tara:strand:- start:285 stop:494 length:210 start_codon:yes stop_codon:yes gene_type:complete
MEEEINNLKKELKLARAQINSEVILNKELLHKNKRVELQLATVLKINDDYEKKIADLQLVVDRFQYKRI